VRRALDTGPLAPGPGPRGSPPVPTPIPTPAPGGSRHLKDLERELISEAFRDAEGNLSRAARALGMPRTTLRAKLRRLGMVE
jgi:DNA-binding NtrC family response regulator